MSLVSLEQKERLQIESQMYLTDSDRHNITFDQLSHTNTQAITLNQDQTTGMIPESYFNINSKRGKRK